MTDRHYEIIVERRLRNRFIVTGRSGAEAAAELGALLRDDHPWAASAETEVSRRLLAPRVIAAEPAWTPHLVTDNVLDLPTQQQHDHDDHDDEQDRPAADDDAVSEQGSQGRAEH